MPISIPDTFPQDFEAVGRSLRELAKQADGGNGGGVIAPSNSFGINVKDDPFFAQGDGVTDDTAAFDAAIAAAGGGNTIIVPAGTYILDDLTIPDEGLTIIGAGMGDYPGPNGTVLKAKAGAAYVLNILGMRYTTIRDLKIDGNTNASGGVFLNAVPPSSTVQNTTFDRVQFFRCTVGLHLGPGSGGLSQADKTTLYSPVFIENDTHLRNESTNGQECVLHNVDFTSGAGTNVEMSGGSLTIHSGQFQGGGQTSIEFTGSGVDWVSLEDVIFETTGAVDIDGSAFWPRDGVRAANTVFQGDTYNVDMDVDGAWFFAHQCRFNADNVTVGSGVVRATGDNQTFVTVLCNYAEPIWTSTGTANDRITLDDSYFALKGDADHVFLRGKAYGDTQDRFQVAARGTHLWGSGSAAQDTNLYRAAANRLGTDDTFAVTRTATTDDAHHVNVSGESTARLIIFGNGQHQWGDGGGGGQDTNLYRNAANELKTDDDFTSATDITAREATARVKMGNEGPGSQAGITFGTSGGADVNVYRSGADELKTDDTFIIGINNGKTTLQLVDTTANVGLTIGGDTNLYRSAADTLKTDDAFVAGSTLAVTGNVGFNGASPASRPDYTVTNHTTDRTYNADSTSINELADILGTLIADLVAIGLLQ